MNKTNFLPYSKRSFDKKFKDKSKRYLAYCKRIYNPYMKKIIKKRKYTYISNYFNPKPKEHIYFILNQKTTYGKTPEFIYFDIQKYYPSVDHKTLKTILVKHYLYLRGVRNLEGKFPGKGLLSSNSLTYFLGLKTKIRKIRRLQFGFFYRSPMSSTRMTEKYCFFGKNRNLY